MSKFTKGLPNSPGLYFCCRNEKEKDILFICAISKAEYIDGDYTLFYKQYKKELTTDGIFKGHRKFSLDYANHKLIRLVLDDVVVFNEEINSIFTELNQFLFSKIEIPRD